MLEIRELRHEYGGRTVLSVPQWSVPQGEACLVIGPSGSGKSTLIAIIAGLLAPSAGSVAVAGEAVTGLGAVARDAFRARHVGLVPQMLHLIGVVSVRDNLRIAQRLAGIARDDRAIDACLESLGIAAIAPRKARDVAVGEAQRVAIARAVVNRPRVILADEPTSALDDASCARALALLRGAATACGATLVIATHDQRIRGEVARRLEL
ncbi:MAG: ATP-binding cassette domain-containing protein [Usitatibacter sp.]